MYSFTFVRRYTVNFNSGVWHTTLYSTLIRSIVVWVSNLVTSYIKEQKSNQESSEKIFSFCWTNSKHSSPYLWPKSLGLDQLAFRRDQFDISFIFGPFNGRIDSHLLENISFYILYLATRFCHNFFLLSDVTLNTPPTTTLLEERVVWIRLIWRLKFFNISFYSYS